MEGACWRSAACLTFVVDDAMYARIPELEDYENHTLAVTMGPTEMHVSFSPGVNFK